MADNGFSYLWGFKPGTVNKEKVMDAIILTSPYDTPLLQLAPKVPATHVYEEWLEDTLEDVSTVGLLEGRGFTASSLAAATRPNNWTQIFGKDIKISLTQMKLNSYGFTDAMAHEVLDGTREVMRNIESKFFGAAGASLTGTGSGQIRLMKTIEDLVTTNKYHAQATAVNGSGVTSIGGALEENIFNTLLQLMYQQGAEPTHAFMGPAAKRAMSSWQGHPVNVSANAGFPVSYNIPQGSSMLGKKVTSYLSDFCMLNLVLDRWVPQASATTTDLTGRVFVLDLNKFHVAFLRELAFMPLAPAGDYVHGQITAEVTCRVLAQVHHGILTGVSSQLFSVG